jgi:phosphate:Na+ symporter
LSSNLLLLNLLGAVALLLWGLGLLKSGVNTAFGAQLRQFLAASTRNRFSAFGAGLLTTLGLQSSTAMAIMVSSFAARGLIVPSMAQAVMLGANVGTSLVTQILSLDMHWLAPAAIVVGVLARTSKTRIGAGVAEIGMGLGLMLLSLRLMSDATEPMRQSEAVAAFFALLGNAPLVAILLAAALAAISASSLAAVLFIASLAAAGDIGPELCLLLVAGSNLGGALPPLLAASGEGRPASRVAAANLGVRVAGCLALLVTSGFLATTIGVQQDFTQFTILAHIGFNIALAIVFLPFVGALTALWARLLPDQSNETDKGPRHLDENLLSDPASALAAATRETLRIGDLVEKMLETSLVALKTNDEPLCRSIYELDDQVDQLQEAVKLYLARVAPSDPGSGVVLDYAANLEHVGDIIERSLSRLTLKKIEKQLQYSPEGLGEIEALYRYTLENLQLAQRVFLTRDAPMARRLMETKPVVRHKERTSVQRHMQRLQNRRPESIQTTSIHMDVLGDLRRINAHLISVAVPILEEAGLLSETRLRTA